VFVFGAGAVHRAGGDRETLKVGTSLSEGDLVITEANGRAQIRMSDGGLIALRPGSELLIEAFLYSGGSDASADGQRQDRSFFKLLKGGLRSITGAVGQAEKEAYRVETPVATIGIRGTDYLAYLCDANCAAGGVLNAGLHVAVNSGGVRISNSKGSIDVDPGEAAYVGSKDQTPAPGPDPQGIFQLLDGLQMPFPQALNHAPIPGGASDFNQHKDVSLASPVQSSLAGSAVVAANASATPALAGQALASVAVNDLPVASAGSPDGVGSDLEGIDGTGASSVITNPGSAAPNTGASPGVDATNELSGSGFYLGPDGQQQPSAGLLSDEVDWRTDEAAPAFAAMGTSPSGLSLDLTVGQLPGVALGNSSTGSDTVTGGGTGTAGDTGSGGDTGTAGDTGTGVDAGATGHSAAAVLSYAGADGLGLAQDTGVLTGTGSSYTANGGGLIRVRAESWDLDGQAYGESQFERGTARAMDVDADGATGVRWGRWSNGRINISGALGEASAARLGDASVHWILRDDSLPVPALPSTGIAQFDLVGGTKPTDNAGHSGVLGSASLLANFDTSTVDASLSLTTPAAQGDLQWDAAATGIPLDTVNATFADTFDSVTVTTADGTQDGFGTLSGFFTGDAAGSLNGAGLGYSLSDGTGTSVSGTAGFRLRDPGR